MQHLFELLVRSELHGAVRHDAHAVDAVASHKPGKAFFALNLLFMYLNGWTSDFAVVVIGGDAVFVALFLLYFVRLRRHGHTLI